MLIVGQSFPTQYLLRIQSHRFQDKRINEQDNKNNDHRADIDPSHLMGRNESPDRPENRFGKMVQNDRYTV